MDCIKINEYCKEKFQTFEKSLNYKSEQIDKQAIDLAKLSVEVANVTKSMNALTKALWGVSGTIIATLIGFFIWYVQSI